MLKAVLTGRYPRINVDSIVDSETFQNPANATKLWENYDILISSVDEYHVIASLLQKAMSVKKPLLIIDAPRLTLTTHAYIPYLNTEKETNKYRQKVLQKLENDSINANANVVGFPTTIDHCLYWAMSAYTSIFTKFFYKLVDFAKNPTAYVEELEKTKLEPGSMELHIITLIRFLFFDKDPKNFANCVDLAIEFFMQLFNYDILTTIQMHPPMSKLPNGELFWADKRKPEIVKLKSDTKLKDGFNFVHSMSLLFAEMFQVEGVPTPDIVQLIINDHIDNVEHPEDLEHISEGMHIETIAELKRLVQNYDMNTVKLSKPIDINDTKNREKIVEFLHAATNIRGANFNILRVSQHKIEEFVYNIKPNINVTSVIASALANLDLLRITCVSLLRLIAREFLKACTMDSKFSATRAK